MFVRAARLSAGDHRPWLGLGVARCDLGRYECAEKAYKTALVLDETSPHALNNLAELHRIGGNLADGIDAGKRALKSDPRFAFARLTLGNLYAARADQHARCGRQGAASADYERAVAEYDQAMAIDKKGSLADRRSLRSYPAYAYSCNGSANVYAKQSRFDIAIARHRKAIALDPRDWFFWHCLGRSRMLQGDAEVDDTDLRVRRYEEAMAAFEEACDRHGKYAWTLYHQAELSLVLGDVTTSKQTFARAVELHRKPDVDRRAERGLNAPGRQGGRHEGPCEAEAILDELGHDCGHHDCERYLAYSLHFLGRCREAAVVFRHVIDQLEFEAQASKPKRRLGEPEPRRREANALLHVLRGVRAWSDQDAESGREQMRRAAGHRLDRGRRRRQGEPLRAKDAEGVLLRAVALLVTGEKARAFELVRGVVPEEGPRPLQSSVLWLCILLRGGPAIDGLDEFEQLLGHPSLILPADDPVAATVQS